MRLHGIVPQGLKKSVADIMEGAVVPGRRKTAVKGSKTVAEPRAAYSIGVAPASPEALPKALRNWGAVANRPSAGFRKAARLRDELQALKNQDFVRLKRRPNECCPGRYVA